MSDVPEGWANRAPNVEPSPVKLAYGHNHFANKAKLFIFNSTISLNLFL